MHGVMEPPAVSSSGGFTLAESDLFAIHPCSVTADVTGDCRVDLEDLVILAAEWLTGP